MSNKRERMIKEARKELGVRDSDKDQPSSIEEEKKIPSFYSGFFYIFAGTTVAGWFLIGGKTLLALAIGTPFILIGMQRMMKASADQFRKRTL